MRLKQRLALAIILLAVLPLAAAGVVLTRAAYDSAYEQKLAEQQQDATLAAREVEAHVASLVRELQMMVRIKGLAHLATAEQRKMLGELLAWERQLADLAWLDGEGRERTRVSLYHVHDENDLGTRSRLPEFENPRASGNVSFGPIEIDATSAEPLMAVSVPERDPRSGVVTGVLVARLRLKHMWEVVGRLHAAHDDTLIYVTDPNGLVVAHPNPSVVLGGTRVTLPRRNGITTGITGDKVLAARMTLVAGARELVVVAEQPLTTALSLPLRTAVATLAIIAGALVAALILALVASQAIIKPVQRLAGVAARIAAGDLSHRADGENRSDEIGDLARAFNTMTARLVELVSTLEARVDSRTRDLSTAQAHLREAIESISEGFVLCDADDKVIIANHRFYDFYPEIAHLARQGLPFRILLEAAARLGLACDVDKSEDWLEQRQRLRATETPHIQHLSSGRWLLVNERRTNSGQMVALYTDITDLKVGEEELRKAKAQAESAAQAKSDFLAAMSHELRTPLNAIIGFSDTMVSGVFGEVENPRYREYVRDIYNSGQHLLSLINDILDLSKIEAGAMEVDRHPLDLGPVVERALSMTRDSALANGLRLSVRLPDDLPPVAADERRLLQVLLNLLSNAVKFTPEGGSVTLSATIEDNMVALRVRDTGIGITAEDIPRAFEAFGQIDSSRSRRFPGSGLGLPLSRKLTEMLGGSLCIDSQPGKGTTVTVRVPAAPSQTVA
ncbi:ATP-binding protein [Magnetospirillum aberrantis]|uniref:histidine kinase n=1 Tax=Magnetospirillum aberrantis SpK TaxID=908842 RepID=A0A7C9QVM8_9PROT|nr:ATP-binding protein [Magnetospirillum aberrantis]NFV81740.1 HAMP domain-containing protein [Magnetospirillum aberrantis SpK]